MDTIDRLCTTIKVSYYEEKMVCWSEGANGGQQRIHFILQYNFVTVEHYI